MVVIYREECFNSCKDNIRDGTFASFLWFLFLVFLVAACADDCTPCLCKVFLCADYGDVHVLGNVFVVAAVEVKGDGGCLVGCEARHDVHLFPECVLFVARRDEWVGVANVGEVVEMATVGIGHGGVEGVVHHQFCPCVEGHGGGYVGGGGLCYARKGGVV